MKPWKIRLSKPQDIPFIYSTWLNSFKYNSSFGKNIRKGVFFENYKLVIDSLLLGSEVQVACDPEDDNVILGYIVFDNELPEYQVPVIHYCFVKEVMRKFGIATDLFKQTGIGNSPCVMTHLTDNEAIDAIMAHNPELTYNPILLFRTE